ncbi:MAG: CHAT domain-containing protein [Cyanobacteria bacterium P01_F01_bin.150]
MGNGNLGHSKRLKYRRIWRFLFQAIVGLLIVTVGGAIALTHPTFERATPQNFANTQGMSIRELVQQGQAAYEMEQYADAIAHWQMALDQLPPQAESNQHLLLLTNLALAHQRLGQWDPAKVMVESGMSHVPTSFQNQDHVEANPDQLHSPDLNVSAAVSPNNLPNAQIIGRFFNIRGLVLWHQDNPELALASWQQAVNAYAQSNYPQGTLGSRLNQARALQALGFMSRAQDDVEAISKELEVQPDSPFKALGLRNVGNVLWQMGKVEDAITTLKNSLEVAGQTDRDRSQTMLILGNVERTATEQALAINDREKTEYHQNQSLSWYRQAADITNAPRLQSKAQVNELNFLVAQTNWNTAREDNPEEEVSKWNPIIERAEAIAPTIDQLSPTPSNLPIQLNYAQSLATIALKAEDGMKAEGRRQKAEGRRQKAEMPIRNLNLPNPLTLQLPNSPKAKTCTEPDECLQNPKSPPLLLSLPLISQRFATIIQHAHKIHNVHLESYAQGELGHLYEQTHDWISAQLLTEQALALANQLQSADIQYRWEWQMGRIFLGQSTLEQRNYQPLPVDLERIRYRAIASFRQAVQALEQVRRDLLVIDTDIQFSFRDDVEPLYRQYADVLLRSPEPSPQTLTKATKLIDSLQLAELENSLRCDVNRFLQISQATVDDHTAVIYPIVLSNRLEVIISMPHQDLQRYPVEVPRKEVDSLAAELRRNLPRASQRRLNQRLSYRFYQWLIEPWEKEIETNDAIEADTIDTLVFVLDSDLKSLPMAALWDEPRQQYLLERYAIAVAPSLQLVKPKPLERPIRVLAAGSTEPLEHPFSQQMFAPLANVENEIDGISEYMPTQTLLNQDFTLPKLKEKLEAESFEILHLATHGEFSSDPNQTFILLNDIPLYSADLDELLRLNKDLQASLKMIVLSACQTAAGDRRATLGLAGLTLRAGAQSALATLWSVDDQSAATLMQEFYRQIADHRDISRAEALRRSQLALWQQDNNHGKDWDAPYFWSPYVLVGNWL